MEGISATAEASSRRAEYRWLKHKANPNGYTHTANTE